MNGSRRAEARGGARLGKPRCARILAITAGSSIAARMVNAPPHWGQVVMSMAKTRLSSCAQLMRVRVEAEERSPSSLAMFGTGSASPGTIWERRAALGASTPWKRMRWSRGRGTRAARRWRNSRCWGQVAFFIIYRCGMVPTRKLYHKASTLTPILLNIKSCAT